MIAIHSAETIARGKNACGLHEVSCRLSSWNKVISRSWCFETSAFDLLGTADSRVPAANDAGPYLQPGRQEKTTKPWTLDVLISHMCRIRLVFGSSVKTLEGEKRVARSN